LSIDLGPEGRYLLDFDTRDLPRYATDVAIVGGGIAGLSAALAAAERAEVLVVLKDPPDNSNTAWAQGGIAAAISEEDSAEAHADDTLRTGGGLCDTGVVRAVAEAGPEAIEILVRAGTVFDRDNGSFALGREAGHGTRRVLHALGDATGAECSRALVKAAKRHPRIRLLQGIYMVDLLTDGDRCVGLLGRRPDGEMIGVWSQAVVLAAGGSGRLFRETTNVRGATGDGIAAAFRAGAALRDLEFVQFHPTTLYLAGSERALVTEAVRGDGARLVDSRGARFLEEVHPAAELAPRDVVSRAIHEHLARPDVTDIFLDMRHWERGHAGRRFPGLVACCTRYGLHPERDPIPGRPAAHYFIGGVAADLDGYTSLPGLFACGEASCTGMHGANRLASNSLLEGVVVGTRTGRAAATEGADRYGGELACREAARSEHNADVDLEDLRKSLVSRTWRRAGIQRDGPGLREAADAMARWRHFLARVNLFGRAGFELTNMLLLGALVTAAALLREESRGTHGRSDFPAPDVRLEGSFIWRAGREVEFRPATEKLPRG
jgi:L-aspartate oxidase